MSDLIERIPEGFTPGPWRGCQDCECTCAQVWCPDFPVAKVTRGEWGDEWGEVRLVECEPDWGDDPCVNMAAEAFRQFTAYGEIPDGMAIANARLIALAPELAAGYRAQAARIAELEAEVARKNEALANVVGCFDAAEAEGLIERMNEDDDDEPGSLAGLIRRRLSFAKGYAIAALAAPDTGGAE